MVPILAWVLLKKIMYLRLFIFVFLFSSMIFHGGDARAQYAGFDDPGSRQTATGGGGLIAVEGAVDGGTVPIGATAQVVVRFRNEGSQPVETGLIRLYPSSTISAAVALNQCEEAALPAGAECAIALSVKGLQAGAWRVEMLMSHTGRTRLVTATLSGSVESSGEASDTLISDVEAIPEEVDFQTLEDNQTLVKPIILRNITSNSIDITDIYIDSSEQSGYSLKTECEGLAAGEACIAIVSWSPQFSGRSSGVLVVKHTGPTGLSSIPLQGEYDPEDVKVANTFPQAVPGRGLLVASLSELDFGTEVETASTITVTLVNSGDKPLTLEDLKISGSDNGLNYKDDGCEVGQVLEPIAACPLTITWSPTRVGTLFDDVQIIHDGARGVLVLPIRGEAIGTVSQDQKAIVLSSVGQRGLEALPPIDPVEGETIEQQQERAARENANRVQSLSFSQAIQNASSVLDGYKITSFAPTRAIVNGPGGSRLVFDSEEIVIGGVPWYPLIQRDGIEFVFQDQRVLMLFDRSLSSINRVNASSESSTSSVGSSNPDSSDSSSGDSSSGGGGDG